jgi:hypothetical protein
MNKTFIFITFFGTPLIAMIGCSLIMGPLGFFLATVVVGLFVSVITEIMGFKYVVLVTALSAIAVWSVYWYFFGWTWKSLATTLVFFGFFYAYANARIRLENKQRQSTHP